MYDENSILSTMNELSLLTNEAIKILNNIETLSNKINNCFKEDDKNIFDYYFNNIKYNINSANNKLRSYTINLNNIISKDNNV